MKDTTIPECPTNPSHPVFRAFVDYDAEMQVWTGCVPDIERCFAARTRDGLYKKLCAAMRRSPSSGSYADGAAGGAT